MAGTDRHREMIVEGPAIVLVEPQLGENIGMVARAMGNFGLADLRLVTPRDGWPNPKAEAAASGAVHVLEGARLFDSVADAIADCSYVVATTARQRDGFKRVLGPVDAARNLRATHRRSQAGAILFGRERFGLYNEEVGLADDIVTFPVNPAFASLNLAQAVLLMSYEWMKSGLDSESETAFDGAEFVPAPKEELFGLFGQLEAALDARGYFRPPERKPVQVENLRAVLTRPGYSVEEIRLLRGVISSLDRFSPSSPRGTGSPGDDPRRMPAGGRRTRKRDRAGQGDD
ncbi:RNA methyltransferase [Oricola thermophila]|uniref:RNA methyltransferase n=1 Tax=Oricola thermophila TaxID=2742145 RepID=A0A6N1VAQ9_9HYPH|nr:RNA methyltransferase [Oricola thermophila]QKV18030.1 RNA methyltransferase [Oricola thermophila]